MVPGNPIFSKVRDPNTTFNTAIRFVFNASKERLTDEARKSWLHAVSDGSTGGTATASVELIIDNSDRVLPSNNKEVSIKREMGLKKNDWTIDGKNFTLADANTWFESAQLSNSSHFIVKQGEVTRLTSLAPAERLRAVLSMVGTELFDRKKDETKRAIADAKLHSDTAHESINALEDKLKEITDEAGELERYQALLSECEILQHALHGLELADVERKLADNVASQTKREERIVSERAALERAHNRRAEVEDLLRDVMSTISTLTDELEALRARRRTLLHAKTQAELETGGGAGAGEMDQLRRDLAAAEEQLVDVGDAIAEAREAVGVRRAALADAARARDTAADRVQAMHRFPTKDARDAWIDGELGVTKGKMAGMDTMIATVKEGMATDREAVEKATEVLEKAKEEERAAEHRAEEHRQAREALVEAQREATDRVRKGATTLAAAQRAVDLTASAASRATRDLGRAMPRGLLQTLEAVRAAGIDGVEGPLYSVITVDEAVRVAVDTMAGNQLFSIIVRDAAVAKKVLAIVQQHHASVGILPLDRLVVKPRDFPSTTRDRFPLIDKVHYDATVEAAVMTVLGRAMVVRELSQGARDIARRHKLDVVTVTGQTTSRHGEVVGGGERGRQSRVMLAEKYTEAVDKHEAARKEVEAARAALHKARTEAARVDSEMSATVDDGTAAASQARLEAADTVNEAQAQLTSRETELRELGLARAGMAGRVDDLMVEKRAKFTSPTQADKDRLTRCTAAHDEAADALKDAEDSLTSTLGRQRRLEATITGNLRPRLERAEKEAPRATRAMEAELRVTQASAALEEVGREMAGVTARLRVQRAEKARYTLAQEGAVSGAGDTVRDLEAQAEAALMERHALERAAADHRERLQATRRPAPRTAEGRQLRDDAKGMTRAKLSQQIARKRRVLEGFSHVNRRAAEQGQDLRAEAEALRGRHTSVTKDNRALTKLVTDTVENSRQSVGATLMAIAGQFREVFEAVVGHEGELRFTTGEDSSYEPLNPGDEVDVDTLTAMEPFVSFSAAHHPLAMTELSGGQRSIIALCLVFAIQQVLPAPFYLFDEVDAALDSVYRHSVAAVIKARAATKQFFITSFHDELLEVCDNFYMVAYNNRCSRVRPCELELAKQVIRANREDRVDGDGDVDME